MEIFARISEIFILGLIGGSVPGPILTAVFTEVLSKGFKKSLMTVAKALIAESLLAVLVLLIFFAWDIPTEYFYMISFGGALVLFWLAYQVWGIEKIANDKKEIFTFPKLFLLTILNGGFWIFWITICVPRAFELNNLITGGHVFFLIAFELGWLTSTVGLGFIFSRFRALLLKKKLVSTVFKVFALLLAFFGLKSIWGSVFYFWG
jgi:threonine/homoserine/homoserine lactone efflux protein